MRPIICNCWILSLFCLSLLLSTEGHANDLFEGIALTGYSGPHLVTKHNVNVRAEPNSNAKKLMQLEQMDQVDVLGRAEGTSWLATQRDGEHLGFVFSRSLTPLLDATLKTPLEGQFDYGWGVMCRYDIQDLGRFVEEETVFISVDYAASLECKMGDHDFHINAMMFASEVPPDLGDKPVYQITLNLTDIATGYEDFLNMTVLYDLEDQKVRFDNISMRNLMNEDLQKEDAAHTLKEALDAALRIQFSALNEKGWKTVAGLLPDPATMPQPD